MVTVEVKIGQFWICFQDRAYRWDVRKVFYSIWMNEWFFSILIRKNVGRSRFGQAIDVKVLFLNISFEMFIIHVTEMLAVGNTNLKKGKRTLERLNYQHVDSIKVWGLVEFTRLPPGEEIFRSELGCSTFRDQEEEDSARITRRNHE